MSYDVEIYSVKYESNYTSNIYDMFTSAFTQLMITYKYPSYFSRWTDIINESADRTFLKALIDELKSNPDKYKKYNPKNGWGEYEEAIAWLQDIHDNWTSGFECRISW